MSWLLVVQPDSSQADALLESLRAHTHEDVVVADSLEDALSLIDQGIPDIVLLSAVIPAAVEEYLITYLGTIPGTRHVRVLGIPLLERSDNSVEEQPRSMFPWRRAPRAYTRGCDPEMFTLDVVDYLAGARTRKQEIELYRRHQASSEGAERRGEPRFANYKVPWISIARFGSGRAALINVSGGGALLRTQTRPERHFLRCSDPDLRQQSRLTLELGSGRQVDAMGQVVRCVPVRMGAGTQYEVAFSFDDTVGLHLPADSVLVPTASNTEHDGL